VLLRHSGGVARWLDIDLWLVDFPALCPVYWWQVTTLWVNYPLLVSQLSLPVIQQWRSAKRQTRATYGCMAAGQSSWAVVL